MRIEPMLARIGLRTDLDLEDYVFEPKIDGIRALCRKEEGLKFFNRRGRDVSARYPEFDFADALAADTCLLDGEIVLYDAQGNPDFSALMKRHLGTGSIRQDRSLRYAVFDILRKDGHNLIHVPLSQRKEILADLVGAHPHLELMVYTRDGRRLWNIVQQRGLEGVIAKKASSMYRPGRRSHSWRKIKAFDTLDAVIVGFTSEARALSALGLALFEGDRLRFIGKVGTGFSTADISSLRELLDELRTDSPAVDAPAEYRDLNWVEPSIVCEVRYLEFGTQGMLRNPSFLRLRPDKSPEECQLETQIASK
jgi:bifunctional non-homologous end joining protein LigD